MSFSESANIFEEESTYADMLDTELVPLVKNIYAILDHVDIFIEEKQLKASVTKLYNCIVVEF